MPKAKQSIQEIVASNVRNLRKGAGFTQRELAEAANLTSRYISFVEKGDRNLRLDTLEKLAGALEVTVCEIVCPSHSNRSQRQALDVAIALLTKQRNKL